MTKIDIKTLSPYQIPYKSYRYLYSPRAETKTPPPSLPKYDDGTFLAQPKLNGSNTLIFISGEGEVRTMNRHNQDRAKEIKLDYSSLHRGKGWMVLNGEYMDKSCKDENRNNFNGNFIIFDILVYDGYVLSGSLLTDRISLLAELYGSTSMKIQERSLVTSEYLYYTDVPNVYRVQSFENNFFELYRKLSLVDMCEGLVLKKKNGILAAPYSESANKHWQLKCRKETKNYNH